MRVFDVYSRRGCHLCEVLIEELSDLVSGRAEIHVHDVDTCADRRLAYGLRVPVVSVDGREVCEYTLDRDAVRALLADQA